jgi:cytidyltransferase-like protein
MKPILSIHEFLTEKKVTVKRKYTENYPAKIVSTSAKVRNAVFDAMKDGFITEEEFNKILTAVNANKRWFSRNSAMFSIKEESGIKKYSLSPYGLKIKSATHQINEGLNIPHKESGLQPVNIFVGRFQPFTLGHVKVFQQMHKKNGLPVVVLLVRSGKQNQKNPFSEDIQQAMFSEMANEYKFLEASYVIPSGAIDAIFSILRPTYEPILWGYGSDRKSAYDYMINNPKYREALNVNPRFTGFEITRSDDDTSATQVRNALTIDNEKEFQKLTPKSIHKFYTILQNELNQT